MKKKWILVANSSQARFYEYLGPNKPFKLVHRMEHPEAKKKGKEFTSDKHGESFDRMGFGRHRMENIIEPKEEENKKFASEICEYLKTAKNEQQFDVLIVACGRTFSGNLREKMDGEVSKAIQNWIPKNFGNVNDLEIHQQFLDYLNV
ncbi:MAG: host attachment protein [Leptonema sp. (in: bacteria)]